MPTQATHDPGVFVSQGSDDSGINQVDGQEASCCVGNSVISSSWRGASLEPDLANPSKQISNLATSDSPLHNVCASSCPGGHHRQIHCRLEEIVPQRHARHLVRRCHATSIALLARPSVPISGPGGGYPAQGDESTHELQGESFEIPPVHNLLARDSTYHMQSSRSTTWCTTPPRARQ